MFAQYVLSLGIPVVKTIGLCDKKTIFWADSNTRAPLENISHHGGVNAFFKPVVGWQGQDIYNLKVHDNTILLNDKYTSLEDLKMCIHDQAIIQRAIEQHPQMSILYPKSVNTLRIVTVRKDAEILILNCVCRIGANGNVYDNWSTGGIAVAVDTETGKLKKHGFFHPRYGRMVTEHPDTKITFEGFEIPNFLQALQMAAKLHRFFYGLHSVGWDIAITPKGPLVVEGNDDWGLRTIQCHDSTFKKRFMQTLDHRK